MKQEVEKQTEKLTFLRGHCNESCNSGLQAYAQRTNLFFARKPVKVLTPRTPPLGVVRRPRDWPLRFFLCLFLKTLDTVLKNCAMSSTLLCLCCHATCRATFLGNPVTTTSRAGAFFSRLGRQNAVVLTILGPHGRLGRCCVQLPLGLFLEKLLTQFPGKICNSQKKKIATPKLPWCNSAQINKITTATQPRAQVLFQNGQ